MTSFDEFLNLKGCTTGTHSSEPPEPLPKPTASASDTVAPSSTDAEGKEVYGTASTVAATLPPLPPAPASAPRDAAKPVSTTYVEEQDDPDATVEKGAKCKRKACGAEYDGGDRHGEECRYHAGVVSDRAVSNGSEYWIRSRCLSSFSLAHLSRRLKRLLVLQATST